MKFSIIGAGNGGQTMAAHLHFLDQDISLYDIQSTLVEQINTVGGIKVEGALAGFAPVTATTDLQSSLKHADAIMVTTTATAHQSVARAIAPYLEDNQIILIFPGFWGALEFSKVFHELGVNKRVIIAETESLMYTCRCITPGHVNVRSVKEGLEFAALPSRDTEEAMERLKHVFPQLIQAKSVLRTTLNTINPLFHVPITLLNMGRIEHAEEYFFYDGASPSVINVVERFDQERLQMGQALGVELTSALDLLSRFYHLQSDSLYQALQQSEAYKSIFAPTTLQHRFIYEDIPYWMNPVVQLGHVLGLELPCINLFIDLASFALKEDFRTKGLHLHDLGLGDLSPQEMMNMLS